MRTERGLVVLDMAGTTIAATDQVPAAMIAAFARAGLRLEPSNVAALRGRSKREAIRDCVARLTPDPASAGATSDAIFDDFRADLSRPSAILESVADLPAWLARQEAPDARS
jgi:beta-phosphoglucomutase-like phosphatase (HAD superfamily)